MKFNKTSIRISIIMLLLMTITIVNFSQDDRSLIPDQPLIGTIDQDNPAQVYTFTAETGNTVTMTLASDTLLTMLVTDATGINLGQVTGTQDAAEVTLPAVAITATGNFYVTIFPSAGTQPTLPTEFTLTLTLDTDSEADVIETTPEVEITPTQAPTEAITFNPGQQISLPGGLEVTLRWDTIDDLNLQVRDPVGETLFWGSRATSNGGTFGADRNGLCEVIVDPPSDQTFEVAEWPGTGIYVGSYEILVYYRQACGPSSPVDFTVDVVANGETLDPITGTISPPVNNVANVYLGSFTIDGEGGTSIGSNGPYTDTRELPIPATEILAQPAEEISFDAPIEGIITNENYYQTYTFEGLAGSIVSVDLTAINGNLDTLLVVFNSAGNIVGDNDDIVSAENTNSAINSLILPADDVYTVMATRYGKDVGGTEGTFQLTISGSDIPQELLDLNLPAGNIQVYLTWNTNADLQLLVRDPFGDTVFNDERTIRSGGRLEVTGNINCLAPEDGGTPLYYTYWPQTTFLNSGAYEVEVQYRSECEDTRPVEATLSIVVEGELIFTDTFAIEFQERYLTSLSIDPASGAVASSDGGLLGGSETLPWQSVLSSATVLVNNDNRAGSITPDDKFDLYIFDGQAGDVVTIDMRTTSGNLDTLLFLVDPNGIEIAANDDANDTTNSILNVTLPQDGSYTIIATHFGAQFGGTIGGYNLGLRITDQ